MTLGSILLFLASIGSLVAWIWFIVIAFRAGEKVWGILLIVGFVIAPIGPFVALAFLVLKWSLVRQPAILFLSSFALAILGVLLFVGDAKQRMEEAMGPDALAAIRAEAERASRPANNQGQPPPPLPLPPAPQTPAPAPAPRPAPAPERTTALAETIPDRPAGLSPRETAAPPPPTHESLNPHIAPGRVELVGLGETSPNQMRLLRLRFVNQSPQPASEVKFDLSYFDARGGRVGGWTTVHNPTAPLVGNGATNEFELQAFFVPQFTRDVRLEIRGITFTNGTRWPARR